MTTRSLRNGGSASPGADAPTTTDRGRPSQATPLEGRASQAPLSGLRVVDLSTWIAGAYCTKLLADGGAEVIKVESPEGDPLRRWSASGATIEAGDDGALFNFLHASKQSVVVDTNDDDRPRLAPGSAGVRRRRRLVARLTGCGAPCLAPAADPPGPSQPDGHDDHALRARRSVVRQGGHGVHPPGLVRGDRRAGARGDPTGSPCTSVVRSASGSLGFSPPSGRSPPAGGATRAGTSSTSPCSRRSSLCLTYYPVTFNDQLGRPMRKQRFVPTPGVGAASDGLVGLGVGTGQQWLDFCAMVEHPEWTEDPKLFLDRTALASDDRRVDRPAHGRRSARPRPRPSASPTHRSSTARTSRPSTTSAAAGPSPPTRRTARRTRARPTGSVQPACGLPEPAPRLGEHSIEAALQRRTGASPVPGRNVPVSFPSKACGCWT